MGHFTTSENNATSFWILIFCRIWIVIDFGVPRWRLSHWKATPTGTPPMNNSKKRVDHPSSAERCCMNGCGLVSMGLVAKQLCGSNGQSRLLQSPCNFLHMPHLWTRLEMLVPFSRSGAVQTVGVPTHQHVRL